MIVKPEIERIPAFDIARAVACLLVVATHVRVNQFLPYNAVQSDFGSVVKLAFFQFTRLGLEAVLVFFCLSGYLIMASVSRGIRDRTFSLPEYAINRASRIYTPYIPSILTSIIIAVALGERIDATNTLLNLLCLQGIATPPLELNSSLWSVSYEVWFYVVWGLTASVIIAKSIRFYLLASLSLLAFTILNPAYLFCWLVGGLVSFVPPKRSFIVLGVSASLLVVGCIFIQLTSKSEQVDLTRFYFLNAGTGVILFGTGCSCALLSLRNWLSPDTLTASIARFFAGFSYSTYLFHIPCIVILRKTGMLVPFDRLSLLSIVVYISNIFIIYCVSYVMYLLFERRTRYVKKAMTSLWQSFVRRRTLNTAPLSVPQSTELPS